MIAGNIVGIDYLTMTAVYYLKDQQLIGPGSFDVIIYCFWLPNTVLIFYLMA